MLVRAGRKDVDPAHSFASRIDRLDRDAERLAHLLGETVTIGRRRAEHLDVPDRPHRLEAFEIGARHPTGAEDTDRLRIGAGEVFRADSGAAADPHVLQHAVIDEGERLAVAGAEEQDKAGIGARLHAVFALAPEAVLADRPGDDIGLHADREDAVARALHRAPPVVAILAFARHIHVEARPLDRAAARHLAKRMLLRLDAFAHGQELGDDVVVNEEHCVSFAKLSHRAARSTACARRG
jgi:hypothetical protein